MTEETKKLVADLIKFGKNVAGIRLIAKLSVDLDCFQTVGCYEDTILQAMEVVRAAEVSDRKTYTSKQVRLLENTIKFMSKQ